MGDCKFSMEDCRDGKSIRAYATKKIRYCRALGISGHYQLLTYVHLGIYPHLAQLVREPKPDDTLNVV